MLGGTNDGILKITGVDTVMPLSDPAIKNAKSTEKPYKMPDEKGMYLLVNPNGSKYFRLDYRFGGKRKTLALGVYPDTSLKQAREKRDTAKKQISDGIDPAGIRKEDKTAKVHTFEKVTRDWFASVSHTVREITQQKKIRRFERFVFPAIGDMVHTEIKSPDVYKIIKPLIAKNQLETAHRVHSEIGAAFAYAIAHGFADYDPAQAVAGQIPAQKVKHRAALTEPKEVAQLLRDICNYQGTFVVQCAFRLSPYLFQRPGEIRQMEWKDVDLVAKEWRYFVTKTEVQHIVPLSTQVVAILEDVKRLTGIGRYVFPSSRGDGRPMSDNTIRTALKSLGYDSDAMTAHGFRTTASTLLNEQGWSPDAIERQLCHMPRDAIRAAYNRAQYLEERRRMMQSWADFLDGLKAGAQVVPFRKSM
ncbi:MAG: tyrosine-type recombinase/integrase [Methylomonas sp.]